MKYEELMLDMFNRIVKLEKEVEYLKTQIGQQVSVNPNEPMIKQVNSGFENGFSSAQPVQRDKTRYMFKDVVYLKNKLVLAVVTDYVNEHPNISGEELKTVFHKSLQGSIGVIEYGVIARQRADYKIRFFADESQVLHLTDGDMFVCSQWGILNISNFIKRAEHLGYDIQEIKK